MFYGRIVRKEDGGFQSMLSEMNSYFAIKKSAAKEVLEGGLYAVQEDNVFHRSVMKAKRVVTLKAWNTQSKQDILC